MKFSLFHPIKTAASRTFAAGLPNREEIEVFGADGEEAICRLLRDHFDCVIRNAVVPHKKQFLEKDFAVIYRGVPFIIEVKNWKGTVRADGDVFYQDKENGVRKTLKSPVGTTKQFISCMKSFYELERPVYGVVVFAEPDCVLDLPEQMDGIALLRAEKLVSYIKACVKKEEKGLEPLDERRVLRCTRFYSATEEFCKGMIVEDFITLYDKSGTEMQVDTTRLRFVTVEPQPLRLRDKLYLTYSNGASGVLYNRDTVVTVACLDGTYRKIALNRIRHIVF